MFVLETKTVEEIIKSIKKVKQIYEIDPTKIRVARAIKGWTISELEKQSGVQRKTITRIEKGITKTVRMETFEKIIKALDQDISFFKKDVSNL